MIREGYIALLNADAGVSALASDRHYQIEPPEFDATLYPCTSYRFVGGASSPTSGTSGTIRQRLEVTSHAEDPSDADALRSAVIAAVNGWTGFLTDGTHVLNAWLINPGTDYMTDDRIFRCMCEFYVLYTLPS